MAIWQDLSIEKEHIGQKPGNLTNTNAEGNSRHAQEGGALKLQCKTTRITGSEEGKGEREIWRVYRRERTSRTTFQTIDDLSQPRNLGENIC